jgi:glyoxylase-like metal-dependent hydrolase (beta-lactamase superfamily II)
VALEVQKLAPGLWRWTAPHPDWTPDESGPNGWERDVGCVYYEAPSAVVLVDPLVPPERDEYFAALDRDVERAGVAVAVLVTVHWHERSAAELGERYGVRPWRGEGPLPEGVRACTFAAGRRTETVFHLPAHRALVAGDLLLGADGGVRVSPPSWNDGVDVRPLLRPLLDLEVELVLVSHGEPVLRDGHAALRRALEIVSE